MVEHVPIQGLDLVEQDLLRQWSHEQGSNSSKIFENYGREFPIFFGYKTYWVIWQAFCELLFALNRPWRPGEGGDQPSTEWSGHAIKEFWKRHRGGDYYWYYDEEDGLEYGWGLYTDIRAAEGVSGLDTVLLALFKGQQVYRSDITMIFRGEGPATGGTEEQTLLSSGPGGGGADVVVRTLTDIPLFPKWSDKIKEKFHRSTDRDMSEWDGAIDDWTTEVQIALNL